MARPYASSTMTTVESPPRPLVLPPVDPFAPSGDPFAVASLFSASPFASVDPFAPSAATADPFARDAKAARPAKRRLVIHHYQLAAGRTPARRTARTLMLPFSEIARAYEYNISYEAMTTEEGIDFDDLAAMAACAEDCDGSYCGELARWNAAGEHIHPVTGMPLGPTDDPRESDYEWDSWRDRYCDTASHQVWDDVVPVLREWRERILTRPSDAFGDPAYGSAIARMALDLANCPWSESRGHGALWAGEEFIERVLTCFDSWFTLSDALADAYLYVREDVRSARRGYRGGPPRADPEDGLDEAFDALTSTSTDEIEFLNPNVLQYLFFPNPRPSDLGTDVIEGPYVVTGGSYRSALGETPGILGWREVIMEPSDDT